MLTPIESVDPEYILVIEDDATLRGTIARTRGAIGRDIRTATTPTEAFREATQAWPDVMHMSHLRRTIEPNLQMPRLIVTEPGVGYHFHGLR